MKFFPRYRRKHAFSPAAHLGMTLMEVVIAIGVIAFAIPLILAATGSAETSRRNAEADTRSAWIARDVQRELILSWGAHPTESIFKTAQSFPNLASKDAPQVLLYNSRGEFLDTSTIAELSKPIATPEAAYIVTIYSVPYNPPELSSSPATLCLLRIHVIHPARATPANRSTYRYNLITSKQGTL